MKHKAAEEKRPIGRPSKYDNYSTTVPELAYKLALLGITEARMAELFDVSIAGFNKWKVEHDELVDALKAGRERADSEVTKSLYLRATGYSHPDTHIAVYKDKKNNKAEVIKTEYIKHYPPDTTACIFWLKNRHKELWRDSYRQEHTGANGGSVKIALDMSEFTDDELAMARKLGLTLSGAKDKENEG